MDILQSGNTSTRSYRVQINPAMCRWRLSEVDCHFDCHLSFHCRFDCTLGAIGLIPCLLQILCIKVSMVPNEGIHHRFGD